MKVLYLCIVLYLISLYHFIFLIYFLLAYIRPMIRYTTSVIIHCITLDTHYTTTHYILSFRHKTSCCNDAILYYTIILYNVIYSRILNTTSCIVEYIVLYCNIQCCIISISCYTILD